MNSDYSQQWTKELTKKRKSFANKKTDLAKQKKETKEEMIFFKKKLKNAITKKDTANIEKYYEKIINLRAKQVDMYLQEYREFYGDVDYEDEEEVIEKYYFDCYKLATFIEKIQQKDN